MGVRKLTTYCEKAPSSVFRKINIADLRDAYRQENPDRPVEIVWDAECCLCHLMAESSETRYGGDMVDLIQILRDFYEKFSAIGIKLVAFFGNFKEKDRRDHWIKRKYDTIANITKIMAMVKRGTYSSAEVYRTGINLRPSEADLTAANIIRFILNETVIQSFTENDQEIIRYARNNKSFAILSQDSDFIIANAAKYYLSMKHLSLTDMTTYLYDCQGLAAHLNLHVNQLPLFGTMMGNDVTEHNTMKNFYKQVSVYENNKMNIEKFVRNVAIICKSVQCNEDGTPERRADIDRLAGLIRGRYSSGQSNYSTMITESIQSYRSYYVEKELRVDMVGNPEHIGLVLTLYRQRWINSDLLMLISMKIAQMGTLIEIFDNPRIKPIGDVLAKLRTILYGATFAGPNMNSILIKEYIITGPHCLDHRSLTKPPLRLKSAQPLESVWRRSLTPGSGRLNKIDASMHECVKVDERIWEKIPDDQDDMMKYFTDVFAEGCSLPAQRTQKLTAIIRGLDKSALVPLFTFIYLEAEHESSPRVYLSSAERSSVLLTFTLVSALTPTELKQFEKTGLLKKVEDVNLIRIANLFMKGTQLIINLSAVCGFPIPLEMSTGHNYWQGSVLQKLYAYLDGKTLRQLLEVVRGSLKDIGKTEGPLRTAQDSDSPLHRFDILIGAWTELGLCDPTDTVDVISENAYRNNATNQ